MVHGSWQGKGRQGAQSGLGDRAQGWGQASGAPGDGVTPFLVMMHEPGTMIHSPHDSRYLAREKYESEKPKIQIVAFRSVYFCFVGPNFESFYEVFLNQIVP